jgi:hypothetical protein
MAFIFIALLILSASVSGVAKSSKQAWLIFFLVGIPSFVSAVVLGSDVRWIQGQVGEPFQLFFGFKPIYALLASIPFAALGGTVGYGIEHRAQEKRRRIEEKRDEERRRREKEEAKARFERERAEIMRLIHQTEDIIQKAVDDATNTEDSLWLSAILIIQQDFRNLCQEFERGGLSHADAKMRFLGVREQAEVLSTPPDRESTAEESKKEPSYYEVLGVDPSASQEEIKRAFRGKVKQYHPDIFMNQPKWVREQAEEMSKKLNEAYETLGDINKRKEYDAKIRSES